MTFGDKKFMSKHKFYIQNLFPLTCYTCSLLTLKPFDIYKILLSTHSAEQSPP